MVKHIFDCFFSFSEPPEIRTVEGFSAVFAFVRCEHRLCSQTRRDTNFAIPGYSISAIIPRREGKSKIFLSVVIHVVKTVFRPDLTERQSSAIARVEKLSGLLHKSLMDRVYALPKQARYQLRYTAIFTERQNIAGHTAFRRIEKAALSKIILTSEYPFVNCAVRSSAQRQSALDAVHISFTHSGRK